MDGEQIISIHKESRILATLIAAKLAYYKKRPLTGYTNALQTAALWARTIKATRAAILHLHPAGVVGSRRFPSRISAILVIRDRHDIGPYDASIALHPSRTVTTAMRFDILVPKNALLRIHLGIANPRIVCVLGAHMALVAAAISAAALVQLDVALEVVIVGGPVVLVSRRAIHGATAKEEIDERLQNRNAAGDDDGAGLNPASC